MTIAERLRDLLQTFIDGDVTRGMNDIQALATEAEGKVLVKPYVRDAWGGFDAGIPEFLCGEDGNGATEWEAIAALQALANEEAT